MLSAVRSRLTYANVMATLAFFIAVGGGAYAAATIDSGDVQNESLKSEDLKDSKAVKGADVKDESLSGSDIDEGSLSSADVPVAGALVAQGSDLGTGGETRFFPVTGRAPTTATMAPVQVGTPEGDPTTVSRLDVWIVDTLASGESRVFTLMRRSGPGSTILDTSLTCTISAGEDSCSDGTHYLSFFGGAQLLALKVENTGAGLSSGDTAFVGMAAQTVPAPP